VLYREGFTYPPLVAARDVRMVCHQLEKICRVVPTKQRGARLVSAPRRVLLEALRG
jgi:hypothetical protein